MSQVTENCNLIGQLLCHIKYIVQIDAATDLCPLKPSHSRARSRLMEVSYGKASTCGDNDMLHVYMHVHVGRVKRIRGGDGGRSEGSRSG